MSSYASLIPEHGMTALDCARELCEPMDWAETITREERAKSGRTMRISERHITHHPSLLDQLADAIEPSGAVEEGIQRPAQSKPASRVDAIDAYMRIDHESAEWLRDLGQDDAGDTKTVVRKVSALSVRRDACDIPSKERRAGCCTRHDIERHIRRWWSLARVLTGWDSPAWRPDATCPLCGKRGGLRVRLAVYVASCTECWVTWDNNNIGLLADHIRLESSQQVPRQQQAIYGQCSACATPLRMVERTVLGDPEPDPDNPRHTIQRRYGTGQYDLTCPTCDNTTEHTRSTVA